MHTSSKGLWRTNAEAFRRVPSFDTIWPASAQIARRRRIGFLYNHDASHQVAHSASIISALVERSPKVDVSVLATSDSLIDEIESICGPGLEQSCRLVRLTVPDWHRPFLRASEVFMPLGRIDHLKHNADLLGEFDALVVTERTSLMLKKMPSCRHVKLIYVSHGSGDRSIGFKSDMNEFDLVLLSGEKLRSRFVGEGIIPDSKIRVVGYPKFDAVSNRSEAVTALFPEQRPTVLYNPHHDPKLSSWYSEGYKVLDYFLSSRKYNLIFAPHVMLFKRRLHISLECLAAKFRHTLPVKYLSSPHILIDTGSPASTNMAYTRAADIYVGDVSSQIYEFISTPRPCVHINAHKAKWRDNPSYSFWHFGQVVDDADALGGALESALTEHQKYRNLQEQAGAATFSAGSTCPSSRAADAITQYIAAAIAA